MNAILITCKCCGGAGEVELNGVYADTLVALQKVGESTPTDLAPALGCERSAMANRLLRLEEMGLVTSRNYGRRRLYKLAAPATRKGQ